MASNGMPWIRVDVGVDEHPKTQDLCDDLDEPLAGMYLIRLWCWVGKFYPTGEIAASARRVEQAAKWTGEAGKLVATMVRLRILDEVEGGFVCHGWDEHNGGAYAKMESDRERLRQKRASTKSPTGRKPAESSDRRATVEQPSFVGPASVERASHVTDVTDVTDDLPPNPLQGAAAAAAGGESAPPPEEPKPVTSVPSDAGPEFERYVEAVKAKLGWANLDPGRKERRAFEHMRQKRSLDELVAALDGLARDAHVRANWKLTQVLSPEGYDRGTRAPPPNDGSKPKATPRPSSFAPAGPVAPPVVTDFKAFNKLGPDLDPEEARRRLANMPKPTAFTTERRVQAGGGI